MNISELFKQIQNKFPSEDLDGEFELHGNCIVWTYVLDNELEEITIPDEDDDDFNYNFEAMSSEEILQETYDNVSQQIEEFLDELEEYDNWTFSNPDINENTISFRIF